MPKPKITNPGQLRHAGKSGAPAKLIKQTELDELQPEHKLKVYKSLKWIKE